MAPRSIFIRTYAGRVTPGVRRGRPLTIPVHHTPIKCPPVRQLTAFAIRSMCTISMCIISMGIIVLLAMTAAACGDDGESAPDETLTNPGFEDGKTGWTALADSDGWAPDFDISEDVAHSGERSALLAMRVPPEGGDVRIFGVTQEVSPAAMPAQLSGWYYVEGWQRATARQYLQVVVIVFGAENRPIPQASNHQIRYILSGISEPPFQIDNARYVFAGPAEPADGEWVPFSFPVADDFARLWGETPVNFEKVRLLFEVRYDGRTSGEQPAADVHYDDLHFGADTGEP